MVVGGRGWLSERWEWGKGSRKGGEGDSRRDGSEKRKGGEGRWEGESAGNKTE